MIARIVIRPGSISGLLILGVLVEESPALKGGRVYEIKDIGGVLTVHDIGDSAIARTEDYENYEDLQLTGHIDSWASRYFDIVARWGLQVVQTLAESRAGVLMRSLVVPERTG